MAERLRQYHYPTWVAERDAVVVEALEAGGSLREVADLVGLTGPGVMKIRDRLKGQGK